MLVRDRASGGRGQDSPSGLRGGVTWCLAAGSRAGAQAGRRAEGSKGTGMRLLRQSQVREDRAGIRGGGDRGGNSETESDLLRRFRRWGEGKRRVKDDCSWAWTEVTGDSPGG